jgi:uncharacterized tellurite resistance protein B-like protein
MPQEVLRRFSECDIALRWQVVGTTRETPYISAMFDNLLRRLLAPAPARLPEPEAKLALAALLVRIARSDGAYAPSEVARIDKVLASTYALSAAASTALRYEAETLETQAPDTVRFTRALKDAVGHDDRIALVEAMWQVVLADGQRDDDEEMLMRLVASLLGITDVESALARQRVERR